MPSWPLRSIAMPLATLSLLMGVSALSGCTRTLQAVEESGDDHFERKEFDAAAKDYEEYVDRSPGNAYLRSKLASTYLAMGKSGMAAQHAQVAQAMRVEDDAIFASTAQALYQDKRYEELNKLLRQRTVDRGRLADYMRLADYSLRQGDLDEAQRAYLTAAKVDAGKSFQPHLALARLYAQIGDRKRARDRLGMAYAVDPSSGEVNQAIRDFGEIPGPTFAITPPEAVSAP